MRLSRSWKRKKRPISQRLRNPLFIFMVLTSVSGLFFTYLWMTKPKELPLQRARLALDHGQPNMALTLLEPTLSRQANHLPALRLKAAALLALGELARAREILDRILFLYTNDRLARDGLVRWALIKSSNLLGQPDFLHHSQMMTAFEGAQQIGFAQADWIAQQAGEDNQIHSMMVEAKFLALEIRHHQKLAHQFEKGSASPQRNEKVVSDDSPYRGSAIAWRQRERESKIELEEMLEWILELKPDHHEALKLYISLQIERQDTASLLWLANRSLIGNTLSVPLTIRLATGLISMPSSPSLWRRILSTTEALLETVPRDQRKQMSWALAYAKLNIHQNHWDRARDVLQEALRKDPHHHEASYWLAKIWYEEGAYREARTQLEQLRQVSPRKTIIELLYGLSLLKTREPLRASRILEQALKLDPSDDFLRLTFLQVVVLRGRAKDYAEDISHFAKAHEANPSAIRLLMQLHQQQGDRKAVGKLLKHVSSTIKLNDPLRVLLMDGYLYLQEFETATQYAQALITNHPQRREGHVGYAASLLGQGQPGRALEHLGLIRNRFPDDPGVLELEGRAYLADQRYRQAIDTWSRLLQQRPELEHVRLLLAETYLQLGLADDAIEQLQEVLLVYPEHPRGRRLIATAYVQIGTPRKAQAMFASLNPAQFGELEHPLLVAHIHEARNEADQAIQVLNRAIASGLQEAPIYRFLASLLEQQHDLKNAERRLIDQLFRQPDHLSAYQDLVGFYARHDLWDSGLNFLQSLEQTVVVRIAENRLLRLAGRYDLASQRLSPLVDKLIEQQHRLVLEAADELARIKLARNDHEAALAVYQSMIDQNVEPARAALRQADLQTVSQVSKPWLDRLDVAGENLKKDDFSTRFETMQRYALLGHYDRALELLKSWIEQQPNLLALQKAKAELLAKAGRIREAIEVYYQVLNSDPQSVMVMQRLALWLEADYDFLAAEDTLNQLVKMKGDVGLTASINLAAFYLRAGLRGQARTVVEELSLDPTPIEPNLLMSLAQSFERMSLYSQAEVCLEKIPNASIFYASAQLTLTSRIYQNGHVAEAREKLMSLMNNKSTHEAVARAILLRNLSDEENRQLFQWVDAALYKRAKKYFPSVEATNERSVLPRPLEIAWFTARTIQDANQGDWQGVLSSLSALSPLWGEDRLTLDLARICVLSYLGQAEEARKIYRDHISLQNSQWATGLRVLLRVGPQRADFQTWMASVYPIQSSDSITRESMGRVNEKYQPKRTWHPSNWDTIFDHDLTHLLQAQAQQGQPSRETQQRLALAYLAYEANFPQLTSQIARRLIDQEDVTIFTHAIYAQALLDRRDTEALETLRRDVVEDRPDSSLALYLQARHQLSLGRATQAAVRFKKLTQRESDRMDIRYAYAQSLAQSNQGLEALDVLTDLANQLGITTPLHANVAVNLGDVSRSINHPLLINVANDLAYLMTQYRPDHLEQAHRIARRVLDYAPNHPSLRDTLGWVEHLQGRHQEALQHLSVAIRSPRRNADVHDHLGSVHEAMGNSVWANYHRQEALRVTKIKRSKDERISAHVPDQPYLAHR